MAVGRVSADLVVAVVAGGLGIATLVLVPHQIAGQSLAAIGNLESPAFFPVLTGAVMVISAGALAVRALVAARATHGPRVTFPRFPFVLAVAAVFVAFAAGTHLIGMLPSAVAVILGLAYLWEFRDWRILVPVAVLVPLAIYVLFEKTLLVILPRGIVFG
jgi:putative tricarboxylic transport membrane protein